MFDINTYLNRITSQHKVKPKFMALVAARLQPFIDLAECLATFDESFDLDKAVGKQLDIIGEYVGVKRLLNFQPQNAPPVLPDPYYRMLIKAKISLNNWDGTVRGIESVLGGTFPQYKVTVVDNQDMTLNVQIAGLQSLFESELIGNGYITPKPMGVLIDYYVLFSIELSTELFIGGGAFDHDYRRTLPDPDPPEDNTKPPNDVFIAGIAATNLVRYVLPNAAL